MAVDSQFISTMKLIRVILVLLAVFLVAASADENGFDELTNAPKKFDSSNNIRSMERALQTAPPVATSIPDPFAYNEGGRKVKLDLSDSTILFGNKISIGSPAALVDGNRRFIPGLTPTGNQALCAADPELSATVDLGGIYRISDVRLWHRWDGRPKRHCSQKIQVSKDNQEFVTVYDTGADNFGPVENARGNLHSFPPLYGRYVRHECGRSDLSQEIAFVEMEVYVRPNDFDWGLEAGDPFGHAVFNDNVTNSAEMHFHFIVGDSRPVYKQFNVQVLESDCTTIATLPTALRPFFDDSLPGELVVVVDIDESLMESSSYWSPAVSDSALDEINFCLRVEYIYVPPTDSSQMAIMNFLNTVTNLAVDISGRFATPSIHTHTEDDRVFALVEYHYDIVATFCNNVDPNASYQQGSVVSICVTTAPNVPDTVTILRIKDLILRQEDESNSSASGASSIAVSLISNSQDSYLVETTCASNECRVMIQIPSVFYESVPLRDLEIVGTALLSLADPELTRRLTEDLPEENYSGFTAKVHIVGGDGDYVGHVSSAYTNGGWYVCPFLGLLLLL